jgi:glutathione S-transferase
LHPAAVSVQLAANAVREGGFGAAHIALVAALGYLDFRLSARDWRAGRPALARWAESVSARPSVSVTAPSD